VLVARAEQPVPPRVTTIGTFGPFAWTTRTDIPYAQPADGSRLDTVNLCRPLARDGAAWAGPYPAILLIHGGGWDSGENTIGPRYTATSAAWCQIWASWGFVAYSVGYRLQDHAAGDRWPAQLVDAQAAVRWVRARAAGANPEHVNPAFIGAMGDSAGGSLAMQLGSLAASVPHPGDPVARQDADQSPLVQFVISAFGPYDWGPSTPSAPLPETTIAWARAAGGPAATTPTLFLQGSRDHIVDPSESVAAYCALTAQGSRTAYLAYDGDHEFSAIGGADWAATVGRLITAAISFAVATGHAAIPPAIPPEFAGPGVPFRDTPPPSCA
jgi:acetyl esterase/lipase